MTQISQQNSRQKLFDFLQDECNFIALESDMQEIERIVLEEINIELIKAEAIQTYLLERGSNDEDINDDVLVLKGLKTREQADKHKAERRTN